MDSDTIEIAAVDSADLATPRRSRSSSRTSTRRRQTRSCPRPRWRRTGFPSALPMELTVGGDFDARASRSARRRPSVRRGSGRGPRRASRPPRPWRTARRPSTRSPSPAAARGATGLPHAARGRCSDFDPFKIRDSFPIATGEGWVLAETGFVGGGAVPRDITDACANRAAADEGGLIPMAGRRPGAGTWRSGCGSCRRGAIRWKSVARRWTSRSSLAGRGAGAAGSPEGRPPSFRPGARVPDAVACRACRRRRRRSWSAPSSTAPPGPPRPRGPGRHPLRRRARLRGRGGRQRARQRRRASRIAAWMLRLATASPIR